MRVVLDTNILVRAATKLNDEKTTEYVAYLKSPTVSEVVSSTAAPRVVPSDPDDDEAVRTAVGGRADWICSEFCEFWYRE